MKTACFKGGGCPGFSFAPVGMHFISSRLNRRQGDVPRWVTAFSATASNPAARTCPPLSIRSAAPIRKLQAEVSALRDLSRNMRGSSRHVRIFMRAECNACRSGADNAVREQRQPICNATRLG